MKIQLLIRNDPPVSITGTVLHWFEDSVLVSVKGRVCRWRLAISGTEQRELRIVNETLFEKVAEWLHCQWI